MTFLEETIECLKDHDRLPAEVLWCGSPEYGKFSWDTFVKLADINYDSGLGGQEIARDLLIVGADFWLERHEYDGSEWWEYKSLSPTPQKDANPKKIRSRDRWATLDEMNSEVGKYA